MNATSSAPDLFGTPVAVLTFIVVGLGFIVSVFTLCWQMAKHVLDGGRLRIYLNAAIWEPTLKLTTNRSGKWEIGKSGLGSISPENIEVAQLVVENPGRTPVTIYNPGVSITGTAKRKYSLSPRMFALSSQGPDSATTETVVRIDPYDRVTFLLDYWSVVPGLLKEAGDSGITIRGSVSVAGRRRLRKSSYRRAWRIPQGAWTVRKDASSISPFTVMWRELFRLHSQPQDNDESGDLAGYELGAILRGAMLKFGDRPKVGAFQSALEQVAGDRGVTSAAYAIDSWVMCEALNQHSGHLDPWPQKLKGEVSEAGSD
ncbi:DUF485 domain-containing protein [Streptomyces rimosus]|uniref:hypothetical protein n=1 Tax=Streptomyces rimosus TaxID=1927 RepID=UPI000B1DAE53|nr:hypothetical protein [Streptomyces rimosus]